MATLSSLRTQLSIKQNHYELISKLMSEISNSNVARSFSFKDSFNFVASDENMNRYWNFDNGKSARKTEVQNDLKQVEKDIENLSNFTDEVMSKAKEELKKLKSEIKELKVQIATLELEEEQANSD